MGKRISTWLKMLIRGSYRILMIPSSTVRLLLLSQPIRLIVCLKILCISLYK